MPLPKPTITENRDNFIDRCMSDDQSIADFPDRNQRLVVCNDIFNDRSFEITLGKIEEVINEE